MLSLALAIHVHAHVAALAAAERLAGRGPHLRVASRRDARLSHAQLGDERGQTSAEYALVLLGAASVALLIAVWAKKTNRLGKLLDAVFDNLVELVR